MSKIPTIAITEDLSGDISDCDISDIRGTHTDVECLDSNDEEQCYLSMKKSLRKPKRSSPAVTDIEDYDDSDDEKSEAFPEIQLSLEEFLDQGYTDEKIQLGDRTSSNQGSKTMRGTFLTALSIDDPGCVTDCENYDTSGDEMEKLGVSTDDNEVDFVPNLENCQITEQVAKLDLTAICDGEVSEADCGACCMQDISIDDGPSSEIDDIIVSGDEDDLKYEIFVIPECPTIDITFVTESQPCRRKSFEKSRSPLLSVGSNPDDPLTDIERLNSSDEDNSSDNELVIPRARVSITSLTDIEDLDVSEVGELFHEMQQISDLNIPAPLNEITIVKEDESGDPVTNVMPLQKHMLLDVDSSCFNDKGLTDTEDLSGCEEDIFDERNIQTVSEKYTVIENTAVRNSEKIKSTSQKKIEYSDIEPKTDIEEIFIAGTVRRKKTRSKTQNKQKSKYLDIKVNKEQNITDIEDLDVSDFENDNNCRQLPNTDEPVQQNESQDYLTDVECISGIEDLSDDNDEQKSDAIVPMQDVYRSTVTSIEALKANGNITERRPSPILRPLPIQSDAAAISQELTDTEDIFLTSDVEDNPFNDNNISQQSDQATSNKFQEALNESSVSFVHEKCGNVFNIDKEKNHIKGMKDVHDTHTDVEYLDEDLLPDNNQAGEDTGPEPKQPDDEKK